ncbi:MAG TPA: hypothetical protein VEY87_11025 [Gaiellaceae bacterium]|nr:hypothetical protein [Gaiellaceae bacterium]
MTLLQLAFGTAVVLAPGFLVARALGVAGVAGTLAWGLVAVFAALGVTFAARASLTLTLVLLLAVGVVAAPLGWRARPSEPVPGRWWVLGAGAVLGLLLWLVAGEIGGDGLFHLARARKLDAFGSLGLDAVNEFSDGGLHPGYAFPLWHGFLALVARIGFLDPADVVLHEATVLAPLALAVTYEAGWALFRRAGAAAAVVVAQVTTVALAPAGGGAYTALGLPATASRQLLVPAALALAFAAVRLERGELLRSSGLLASVAAAAFVLAVVHPTYVLFLWLPFAGFVLVRLLVARSEAPALAATFASLIVPSAIFLAWLLPVVRETASVKPGVEELERAFAQYEGQLQVVSETSYRLAPAVFGRSGAVAVAALLLLPLAGLALRRRWGSWVLGGSLAIFATMLLPQLFVLLSDLVSISQSRRAAGFLPFAFAFAVGLLVLATYLRVLVVPLALAAGVVLQLAYPGDFGYRLGAGGPALATWWAVAGGVVALVGGLAWLVTRQRKRGDVAAEPPEGAPSARGWRASVSSTQSLTALAAVAFVLPVAVHAAGSWTPSEERRPSPLTPGLVQALRTEVPRGAVVYSDLETSYRIAAFAPLYVAAAPPGHVADTERNRPYARRDDNRRFFRSGDLDIPRSYGASWLVVDRRRFELAPQLPVVHRDGRFTLYRLP